ncbi:MULTISPECIES: HAD family hydrolase [unclassified Arthrobacter]|uniref:HAD family hydrolase n=1 Tax=unclassified Arthrobacter TaxID=235627 RepID=UPI001492F284|nr:MULTISPECIES: HAD family hydrolase [unclassified Arthrobacter]MBE0008400.1 HAD family hydrolase [Arthrobacter sp. AET 35A]NOJ62139.1 HAD family hydrolase [Arthrobacter sp. 147(2020)]
MKEFSTAGTEDRQPQRKLIALDIDGTLVDHDGHMSDEVRDAARAVVGAGHEVIIATGRSLGAALPIIEQLGIERGYSVCSNGGVTLRVDSGTAQGFEIVDRVTFDPRPALVALRERLPTAKYALEDDDGNFLATEPFQDASFGAETRTVDFEDMLDAAAVRVVVFSTDSTAEQFGEAVEAIGLHGVTYSVGWTAWLDIAAAGVTKASALELLRRRLDIAPSHTVAIGDGRNDIEMLVWAARSVAMGQSPDEVLAAATEVTASVYDDGAAKVLRTLL